MDFVDYLCCLIPRMRRNYLRQREKKTRIERLREKMKTICRLQVSRSYQIMKDRILGRISFNYSRIVVIWVRPEETPRALVISRLQTYGVMTFTQDRWSLTERGEKMWRGILVEFARKNDAVKASLDLPSQFKYVRSTLLETVMNTLADCEMLHPEYRSGSTKLVINRKVPLRVEEIDDLHRSLCTYGPIATFFINNRRTTIGAVCEVTYTYLTQAYLAMIMTDGYMFSRGVLTAVINKTYKDRQVLEDAKECIVLLSQCCFPN